MSPHVVSRRLGSHSTRSARVHRGRCAVLHVLRLCIDIYRQKCNMDRNCPDHYREPSAEDSLKSTRELITYIGSLNSELIRPVLTPRFAISCTGELLRGLGDMANSNKTLAIQTHIAENKSEIIFTKDLFKECKSYADVYDQHGLLCERTILAHAVHLDDHELDLVKKAGAGISHCPTSNFNLRSGMANVGEMLDRGIKVAHCSLHVANTVI